jgi:copper resistance protein B
MMRRPLWLQSVSGYLLLGVSGIAMAQDMGHAGMQMPMPMPARAEPHPAVHHGHVPAKANAHHHEPARVPATSNETTPSAPPADMSTMTMDHGATPGMASPDTPRTPIPTLTDSDRAAAVPPPHDHPVHDNPIETFTLFNRFEGWNADPGAGMHWEGKSWIGTDLNRLWLRSEGTEVDGRLEDADVEVLYGHSVSAWWDVLAGLRHDFKPGESQDFAAIGVQGVTPYKFDVAATAYVGQSGQTAARFEGEYELLLTNRLILQPLVEINVYGQGDARRGIGAGLSTAEAGLRLRYEITRRFAPYIGVIHERAYGSTADLRRDDGVDPNETRVVAGVRIWF